MASQSTKIQDADLKNVVESNDTLTLKTLIQTGININAQDKDGNTLLHHAISSDSDVEILRELSMAGANVSIENNAGTTPLHCIQPKSIDTMINLLRLEKGYHLFDEINNNVLGVLVGGRISQDTIDDFWKIVLHEFSLSDINVNFKNDLDETLLHLAARQIGAPKDKHLSFILSNFDNLNQLAKDLEGRNFLHVIFDNQFTDTEGKYSDFISSLVQCRLTYCSKSLVKSLLNSEDNYKDTPLHKVLRNPFNIITPNLLEMFVEAGADLNHISSYHLSILHHVIRNQDTRTTNEHEVANIDYVASKGNDVNATDNFGGSPIYYCLLPDSLMHLMKLGARLDLRNKFGQTALVFHVCLTALRDWDVDPYNVEIFKSLLDNGSDVDAVDNNGNSILHYAAWQGIPLEIVQLFLERNAKMVKDNNGQLPCDIAFSQGNRNMVELICNCESHCHLDDGTFFPDYGTIIDNELKELEWDKIECMSNFRSRMEDKSFLSRLLRTPGIGAVDFIGEAADLRSAVTELVNEICTGISKSDELFSCFLIQAGSVGEKTKIGLPDEFDFVCTLDRISQMCFVEEQQNPDRIGYAHLILKDEFKEQYTGRYFDREGHLKTHVVWTKFRTILGNELINSDLFSHPNIFYAGDKIKGSTHPTCQFSLMWMGSYYKCLKIDIDLVPAVHVSGWWPETANIQNLSVDAEICKNHGFMLLIQTTMNDEDQPSSKSRISAQRAEKMHMSQLPQLARDAYMLSKIMCNRICPELDGGRISNVGTFITSYMLKNCMFYVYQANKKFHITEETYVADKLHEFVFEIFRTLRDACAEETLVSYILPWQNIFEFAITLKADDEEDSHSRCAYRSVFAKIIVTMLGETQRLSSSEEDVLFEYESWFSPGSANEDSD